MSNKPIKIASLGLSQSNFLNQLYGLLKEENPNFSFHVDRFRDLSNGTIVENTSVFDEYHDFSKEKFSKVALLWTMVRLWCMSVFWKYLFFELANAKSIKDVLISVKNQAIYKHIAENIILPMGFKVVHIHFCTPYNLRYVPYLQNKVAVVCSFWGSDLYRNPGKRNKFYVADALERATAVTIQTPEMGTHLFKKYGTQFKDHIVYAQFAIETKIYNLLDTYKEDLSVLSNFKRSWNIPEDHIVVTVGYNANEAFKHIEVLDLIRTLPKQEKDKITCLLPLTYSKDKNYLRKLSTYLNTVNDVQVVCINEFISHEDLAKLRHITDIQIQVPVSDALSGSVTEVLYAGNVVIAGSWLPYTIFKRSGINYETIDALNELPAKLQITIQQLSDLKTKNRDNYKYIKASFFPEYTMKAWHQLYASVI